MTLEGRRIVLGVTGGIAAYKAIEVMRRLVDAGAHVVPVLTPAALNMVGPTTFTALASEPVKTSLWQDQDPIPHTTMGQQADLIVVCPATARIISDLRTGRSADLLSATLLATRAPVVLCPAMHTEMWEHPATQENLDVLAQRGVTIVPPEAGRLAGGDIGFGRLASPETVVGVVESKFLTGVLADRRVLVTAGGTREAIDPVRYIGNRSSGKQGYALAEVARKMGAQVTLVSTVDRPVSAGIEVIAVETAAQMHDAVMSRAPQTDVVIMAAAVADFRPVSTHRHKIKKAQGAPQVVLEPTVDILAELGKAKSPTQFLVGFAAETNQVRSNAESKLTRKNIDMIVANDVSAAGVGFGHDTNEVSIITADGSVLDVVLSSKLAVAEAVLNAAASRLQT